MIGAPAGRTDHRTRPSAVKSAAIASKARRVSLCRLLDPLSARRLRRVLAELRQPAGGHPERLPRSGVVAHRRGGRRPRDWPVLLADAGLRHRASRTFLLDLPAPVSDEVRGYAVDRFSRIQRLIGDRLTGAAAAALARLLDPDDPTALANRPDLFMLAATRPAGCCHERGHPSRWSGQVVRVFCADQRPRITCQREPGVSHRGRRDLAGQPGWFEAARDAAG